MILGVYWYFKFPEDLYHFRFFKFFEGHGGHIDNDALLKAGVQVDNINDFIQKLEELKTEFKEIYVHLNISENQLIINISDHQFFDYHFQLALEIEKLLIHEGAVLLDHNVPFKTQATKSYYREKGTFENKEHRFIQMVGSEFKKSNAQNYSIRIDCNLPLNHKKDFIHDLVTICKEENIHVFYYHDCDFKNHCNMMLFFSNGRQRKEAIQKININSFGAKVRFLREKYLLLHFGHLEGITYYPLNGNHVELMTDEEYILNT